MCRSQAFGWVFGLNALGMIGSGQLNRRLTRRWSARATILALAPTSSPAPARVVMAVAALTGWWRAWLGARPAVVRAGDLRRGSRPTPPPWSCTERHARGRGLGVLRLHAVAGRGGWRRPPTGLLHDGTARPMALMVLVRAGRLGAGADPDAAGAGRVEFSPSADGFAGPRLMTRYLNRDSITDHTPMPSPFNLKGQAAIVTGSTSGIGQAMAEALAGRGRQRRAERPGRRGRDRDDRAEIEAEHGVARALPRRRHDQAATRSPTWSPTPHAEFGRLDILVNNAGVQHVAPVEEFPVDKWDQIIAINLSSAFHAIRAAVPIMKAQGRGRIVNIASAHGLVASPFKSAYVAAKHGVLGFTKTVALEVATDGITCNAICPGYVKTPLVEAQIADQAKARGISRGAVVQDVILAAQPTKQFVELRPAGRAAALPGLRRRRLGQRRAPGDRRRLDGAVATSDPRVHNRAGEFQQARRGRAQKALSPCGERVGSGGDDVAGHSGLAG